MFNDKNFIKGPAQMLFSSVCFAFMAYFAKLSAGYVSGAQIVFYRFAIGMGAMLLLAFAGKISLKANNKALLIWRGVVGSVAVMLYFWALAKGSLTNSAVLNNTHPIFASIIAAIFLGERLGPGMIFSIGVAWAGIAMLIHPDPRSFHWPDIIALASGIFGGVGVTIIRQLRRSNETTWNVFFYLSIFGAAVSLIMALPVWVWPGMKGTVFLFATGIVGLAAQLTLTSAYKYCRTAAGGVLSTTAMVFSSLLGVFVLGERLNALETAGIALITAGCVLVVVMEGKQRLAQEHE